MSEGSVWLLGRSLLLVLSMIGMTTGFARAQTPTAVEKLQQEFTDPLTTLPQIFVKDVYSPANYGTNAQSNVVVARAIIPRLPKYSLFPFIQLIRPTFQLVTTPTGKGSATRTEFGDISLFDLAVLPWPGEGTGIKIGVGPTFVFPTATSKSAGQSAWQAGPAIGAVYTGLPWFVAGFLFQNPVSFAYTSSESRPVNTLQFQPVLLFHLWHGWYLRSADATWICNWHSRSPTMIPLSVGIGRVVVRPGLPPLNFYVSGQWMAYRQFSPGASQSSVTFGVTVAFPEYRKW